MKLKKLFGNIQTFAIECEIVEIKKYNSFGFICVWLNQTFVGEFKQYCMLNIPFDSFSRSLPRCVSKEIALFQNKSKEEVLKMIKQVIYESEFEQLSQAESIKLRNRFQDLEILVNWGESFDGWYTILIDDDDSERFIWEKTFGNDQYIKETFLPKGTYQNVVSDFLEWFNSICGNK